MKVSKEIKDKMHKAAKCFAEGNRLIRDIKDYLESCGFDLDEAEGENGVRCGNGYSSEELEAGNDVTDKLVEWVEEAFEAGNDATDKFVEWIEEKLNSSFSFGEK